MCDRRSSNPAFSVLDRFRQQEEGVAGWVGFYPLHLPRLFSLWFRTLFGDPGFGLGRSDFPAGRIFGDRHWASKYQGLLLVWRRRVCDGDSAELAAYSQRYYL